MGPHGQREPQSSRHAGLDAGWGAGCGMQGWPPPHVLSPCHLSTHGDKWPLGTDSGSPCSAQHLAEQGGVRGSRLRSFQRIKPNPQTQTRSRSARSASPRLAGSVARPQGCECCGLLGWGWELPLLSGNGPTHVRGALVKGGFLQEPPGS